MQKVVYSIPEVNKEKLKGVGYLIEGNLLITSASSRGGTKEVKSIKESKNFFI